MLSVFILKSSYASGDDPAGDGACRGGEVDANADGLAVVGGERQGVMTFIDLTERLLRRAVEFQFDDVEAARRTHESELSKSSPSSIPWSQRASKRDSRSVSKRLSWCSRSIMPPELSCC